MLSITSIPNLSSLDTDLISDHVTADLEPGELLNYVLASKEAYSKRDQYVRANKYTQEYSGDYFADLLNSHVVGFKNGSFVMSIPTQRFNPVFITNTYKLIAHSHQVGYPFPINTYFQYLIKAEFNYTINEACESHFSKICNTKWWASNVDIYEIYKILYHLANKKHRHLGEALESFTFFNADKLELKNTLAVLSEVFNPEQSSARALRAIMFYLLYSYMEFLSPIMVDDSDLAALAKQSNNINSTTRYIALAYTFYEKNEDTMKKLSEIKEFPDYIKNKMNKKYMQMFKIFEEILSKV